MVAPANEREAVAELEQACLEPGDQGVLEVAFGGGLGCASGDSETEAVWTEFLWDLRDRGLTGVQLVISDAHRGLVNAIGTALQASSWQCCRVHFRRNVLAKVSKSHDEMVAATTLRTIFAQPSLRSAPRSTSSPSCSPASSQQSPGCSWQPRPT